MVKRRTRVVEAAAKIRIPELGLDTQVYGVDPLADRETDLYRGEYIMDFVGKWDELIDWTARAESEGQFFIDVLRARGKTSVLDVASGTGFHSIQLSEAGFDVTSADGSAAMLSKAFENGQSRGLILKVVQADWRWLNRSIHGKYDAIICLGNSFTHLHEEQDRRRALAEFYAALKHDGVLVLDQRNYDTMLDEGFRTKHKYYYCGDEVSAEPEHIDEGLVRMKYSFPDGSNYTLNLSPIRKGYVRRLLTEAGFQRVRTYGDFQETYAEGDPDFFVHVAEKSELTLMNVHSDTSGKATPAIREITEHYYDSEDADHFYSTIWGGEDLHLGIYDKTQDIREASDAIVDRMSAMVPNLSAKTRVLDLGSGYGGSMRRIVKTFGCRASCLNLSEVQNDTNRLKTRRAGLTSQIDVLHGTFEAIPDGDASFDVVWSQDALLHSDQRAQVLGEAWRVLKPGGYFVFTDPCQADDVPEGVLQPVYDRLQLNSLGSFGFYREAALATGFELECQEDLTEHLRTHYDRVREELKSNYDSLRSKGVSARYLDDMMIGLEKWVEAADQGHLAWGIHLLRKPT
jgi:glycine/sarcosine/dimethylglycine N-methyltransferase